MSRHPPGVVRDAIVDYLAAANAAEITRAVEARLGPVPRLPFAPTSGRDSGSRSGVCGASVQKVKNETRGEKHDDKPEERTSSDFDAR